MVDGPSWPHDGPFGEEISARRNPGLAKLPAFSNTELEDTLSLRAVFVMIDWFDKK